MVFGIEACKAPTPNKMNTEVKRVEDSIKNGNLEAAKQLIAQHMSEATDSDMYYRWLSVQNRLWYAQMNVDSMTAVSDRIYQYLSAHDNKKNAIRSLLWAEWYKTKAVFLSAILGRPDSALIYNEKAIRLLETQKDENEFRLTAMTNQAFYYHCRLYRQERGGQDSTATWYKHGLHLYGRLRTKQLLVESLPGTVAKHDKSRPVYILQRQGKRLLLPEEIRQGS